MTARAFPIGVLDPLSSSSLNKLHDPVAPPFKKRKIESNPPAQELATTRVVIRAHAASLSDTPHILWPVTAFPRSRLPLSWLENATWSRSNAFPGGLFVADIPTLEADLRGCVEPTVLVMMLDTDSCLYVVERVRKGIYSLSRLARGLREDDVFAALKGWKTHRGLEMDVEAEDQLDRTVDPVDWWHSARIEEPASDLGIGEDFAALQVNVAFGPSGEQQHSGDPSFVDVLEHRGHDLAPVSKGLVPDGVLSVDSQGGMDTTMDMEGVGTDMKQTPEELLSGMRDQYLQALYISKTSVAYFAKGPLTRCRNAFQTSGSDTCTTPTLIEFYREAILVAKKMDVKYRETLPTSVRDAVLALSDGEHAPGAKKRKSKKKKLGKNGLYPEEDDFIRKWWKDRSTMERSALEISREAETKKHISDLRLRETQLQILLILEVMALESTPTEGSSDAGKVTDQKEETPKKSKAKKPQDLSVLLELHLDRLCIWHAVSLEESSAVESAKASSFNEGSTAGKKVESDAVRDFCTEVIIPFYAARLPDKCKLITRKFGVSGGISPAAKKPQKRERVEPGADVKQQHPAPKPRRSLQRVLTDEKAAAAASQNRHPTLSRSNTAPSKQETKRDSIESLLPTVLSGSVRGGIQQAKRVGNREVDLNAVARQHESKLRKVQMLVDQKKELDAAIHAIRKPNRELVARDIAEDVVDRTARGGGSSRKPKNPVRNPMGEGVQVMATPRGNRKKDAVVGLPPLPRSLKPSRSFAGEMENHSLDESPVMIPSSGSMRRTISFSGPDATPFNSRHSANRNDNKRKQPSTELGSIQETPSRPPSRIFDEMDTASTSARPPSSGKGLFRVPNLPAPRSTDSTTQSTIPSTPVSSRQKHISPRLQTSGKHSNPLPGTISSAIMETPPKQNNLNFAPAPRSIPPSTSLPLFTTNQLKQPRAQSPPAVMGTPTKGAAVVPVTPEKAQTKSIYEQLGWDDEEMEL